MPTADKELMVNHHTCSQDDCHLVDLKEDFNNGEFTDKFTDKFSDKFKDGADIFGPQMQQLHLQLLQQHEQHIHHHHHQAHKPELEIKHAPAKKEASIAKKAASLIVWFLFNSLTLILNK